MHLYAGGYSVHDMSLSVFTDCGKLPVSFTGVIVHSEFTIEASFPTEKPDHFCPVCSLLLHFKIHDCPGSKCRLKAVFPFTILEFTTPFIPVSGSTISTRLDSIASCTSPLLNLSPKLDGNVGAYGRRS